MNPKQKAENLVNKYRIILMNENTDCGCEILCTSIAKQNVIIAVDEILNFINPESYGLEMDIAFSQYDYWNEVKKEIEKL